MPLIAQSSGSSSQKIDSETNQEPESIESLQKQIEATTAQMQARRQLRLAEQRDRDITEQIRAIYAEQDALTLGILAIESEIEAQIEDESLALILALAS